jgi:hydroxypyruvate isomerase
MNSCLEVYECQRQYNRRYDQRIAMFRDNDINLPLFDTTALFLKISSGTYTLDRIIEEDSTTEKYDIFRVQKYAGTLIKLLGKSHPVL